jgi:hypothetical protein
MSAHELRTTVVLRLHKTGGGWRPSHQLCLETDGMKDNVKPYLRTFVDDEACRGKSGAPPRRTFTKDHHGGRSSYKDQMPGPPCDAGKWLLHLTRNRNDLQFETDTAAQSHHDSRARSDPFLARPLRNQVHPPRCRLGVAASASPSSHAAAERRSSLEPRVRR